ncbi:MAG TPA: hypothetical protein VN714_25515 [Trebonia sp.]|jgi:hypothetical protein|nr:hypothetical protein [Trebonia sp.]
MRAQGQPGQATQPGQQGGYGGYPGNPGPGYPGGGQPQAGGGYADGQYGGGGYPGGDYQGGGYGGQRQPEPNRGGQAPWPDQQAPDQYAAQQQAPQQQAPRHRAQQAVAQPQEQRNQTDETPSWAEPDSVEEFSERWHRRGHEARREEQQKGQRKRRRLLIAGGAVVALAIAVTIYLVSGGPGAASLGFGNFVTNFLPGEMQTVPNPCTTVSQSTLNQYLPGKTKQASPPQNSGAFTECTWTLDSQPTFRVIDVQVQAYSPSGLASGNGSATFAAQDAFQMDEIGYTKPNPKGGQSTAKVTDLTGMPGGTETSAFQATQVTERGGATVDETYVYVRYRNVIVQVKVDGLNQDSGGKHYTAAMSDLTPAANAVAKEMAAQIVKQS